MPTHDLVAAQESSVAVILTCYNEGPYIGAAVRSVLAQTRADLIESIVIADDGSESATIAVLQDIETWDPRIQIIYGAGGAGQAAQRNLAIQNTRGTIVAILDGDDVWTADKLQRQVPALLQDPTVGLVYAGYYIFASEGMKDAYPAAVRDITSAKDLKRAFFMNDPPIIPSTTLIRRSEFEKCGGFDATIRVFEETDFYLRLASSCRFAFIPAALLYKRIHTFSVTRGRKDHMAYHAFVAFKAAADDPRLLPLVLRRLAERARKLGNHYFLLGEHTMARPLLLLATRLNPYNVEAWISLAVAACFPRAAHALMASRWKSRRAALGVSDGIGTPACTKTGSH